MIFGKRTRNTKKDDCSDNSVMCSKVIPSTNSLENASTTRSNYNTDRAIKSVTEDLLGRAPFSQTLGKAIYEYKGEESLVIGLFGKWGTGKTSVANMALQTLEELSVGDDKPIIIRFAPWNYSDKDNLINRFFAVLMTKIDLDKNEEFKKKVGQALQDYSGVLDFASLIPGIGGSLVSTIKSAAKAKGEALSKPLDLDATKERLNKVLIEAKRKIIILIDDIDRLTNPQIRDIFQLVKQVGDLPYITYILAMDREVVRRALAEVHNTDGNEYLEKIIQIPFEMPELRQTRLHEIFFRKLDHVINELPEEIQWDTGYWNKVFENCIAPYLKTLRDVNRVINTFRFRYSMLCRETCFEDMISITVIEVLEPVLYRWIAENKEYVCGGLKRSLMSIHKKPEEIKKQYEEEFHSIGLNSEKTMKCLSALFPVFAKDVNAFFYTAEYNSNVREQMRAAQPERFDLYFMFDLESIKVSRSQIKEFLFSMDEETLKETIENIDSSGDTIYFLEEVQSMIDKLPQNRIPVIANVLFKTQHILRGETNRSVFTITADYLARECAEKMIHKLEKEEQRYVFYKSFLEKADKDSIGVIAFEIRQLEHAFGRFSEDQEKREEQYINLEQLIELESLFLAKVKAIGESSDLVLVPDFAQVFYLWKALDKEGWTIFVDGVLKNRIRRLRLLCAFAYQWHGTGGTGGGYNVKNYAELIDGEEAVADICGLSKVELEQFTGLERIKLASFVLSNQQLGIHDVNIQRAIDLVKKWEEGK